MTKVINIHEAKTHLSRLIEEVLESGEPFIIAKAGRPCVQVAAVPRKKPTFGSGANFWKQIDTDEWDKFDDEIAGMFKDSVVKKQNG